MAMVAALELEDGVAARRRAGEAQGEEGRLRARAAELQRLGTRRGGDDLLAEADGLLVDAVERRALADLGHDGRHHLGMGVAQQHGARAQDVVEVLTSLDVPDAAPRSAPADELPPPG